MSPLQVAILTGCLVGGGFAIILVPLLPAQPHLAAALDRLNPDRSTTATVPTGPNTEPDLTDRVGLWAQRRLPAALWFRVPTKQLRILRKPLHRHLGEKVLYFLLGLVFPPLITGLLLLFGTTLPITVPALAGLALGAGLSFLPDYNARDDASARRDEFTRSLGAFLDQVAMEKVSGSGPVQALERAAQVGDSWVFARLEEVLNRARLAGLAPWDGLTDLSEELDLPELSRFADTMRISGEEGAAVLSTLRASARGLRIAILTADQATAGAGTERMTLPRTALALVFFVIILTPPVLQILGLTT